MKLTVVYKNRYNKKYVHSIAKVLDKLPKLIRDKISENCIVFLIGNEHGSFSGYVEKCLIILNYWQMEINKVNRREREYLIAHEFAHYILGHKLLTKDEEKVFYEDDEKEADDLATEWGFPSPNKK